MCFWAQVFINGSYHSLPTLVWGGFCRTFITIVSEDQGDKLMRNICHVFLLFFGGLCLCQPTVE